MYPRLEEVGNGQGEGWRRHSAFASNTGFAGVEQALCGVEVPNFMHLCGTCLYIPAQAQGFSAMEMAILNGKFTKIGSVLIEQDGNILYEHYFAGDRSTLRDTRSATKTITSLLVGIALDEGKLDSVSAPVLPYFSDCTIATLIPGNARLLLKIY